MKKTSVFLFALLISTVSFNSFGLEFLGSSDPAEYYKGLEDASRHAAAQRRKQRRLFIQEHARQIPRPLNAYGTEALLRERERHLNMILLGGGEWRLDKIHQIDATINYKASMQAISDLKLGKTGRASEVLTYYIGENVTVHLLSDGNFELRKSGIIWENRVTLAEMQQGIMQFVK